MQRLLPCLINIATLSITKKNRFRNLLSNYHLTTLPLQVNDKCAKNITNNEEHPEVYFNDLV